MSRKTLTFVLPVLTGGLFVALWSLVWFSLSGDQKFLLPTPAAVIRAFGTEGATLWRGALNTAVGAMLGFLLAIAVSVALAVLLSLTPLIRASLYPYLMMLQMTPVIVFAPVLILWVGAGLKSVVVITFLICFFPLVVNTTQGLISTDRNLVSLFKMYRAGRFHQIILLRLPSAMPYFFTGLRIAAILAPIGAIVGDYTAGNSGGNGGGLGYLTIIYSSRFEMGALFATAFTGCLLGFVFAAAVSWLSWLALRHWHDSYPRTDP